MAGVVVIGCLWSKARKHTKSNSKAACIEMLCLQRLYMHILTNYTSKNCLILFLVATITHSTWNLSCTQGMKYWQIYEFIYFGVT